MFGWLKEKAWMLGFAASAAIALGLGFNLYLMKQDRDKYFNKIYGPTGYLAQVTTCHNNVTSLEGAIKRQNEAVDQLASQSKARVDKAALALSEAQRHAKETDIKLAPVKEAIKSDDVCDRYKEVDARFVEFLK